MSLALPVLLPVRGHSRPAGRYPAAALRRAAWRAVRSGSRRDSPTGWPTSCGSALPVGPSARTTGGVEVTYDGGGVEAGRVIVALPTLAGRIRYSPALPPLRDQLTRPVPMGYVIKCRSPARALLACRGARRLGLQPPGAGERHL